METKFKPTSEFENIKPGDLVRVSQGPLAGTTQIVRRVGRTLNTFSPICGWYGGPSLFFVFALEPGVVGPDRAHHFQLDQEQPVQEQCWVNPVELEAEILGHN